MSTFKQEFTLSGIDPQDRPELIDSQVGGVLSNYFEPEDQGKLGKKIVLEIETLMKDTCYQVGENALYVFGDGFVHQCEIKQLTRHYAVIEVDGKQQVTEYRNLFKASDVAGAEKHGEHKALICAAYDLLSDQPRYDPDEYYEELMSDTFYIGTVGKMAFGILEDGRIIQAAVSEQLRSSTVLKTPDGQEWNIAAGDLYPFDTRESYSIVSAISRERRKHTGCEKPDLC
ncbi:hypothetical protein [Gimesia chilikensis]|uniref:hypothetical protein n=1 Tax=Gimesia chilikensis TaxID=2605989 RepID=UPI003A8EC324